MASPSVAQQSAAEALAWLRAGRRVAAALLVDVEGSAPLDPGATMYVDAERRIEGSITGGCVESAVVQEATELLAGEGPARLVAYGISDELAGTVGLTCGGIVHVLVHELRHDDRDAAIAGLEALAGGRPAALATILDGETAGRKLFVDDARTLGTLGRSELLDYNVEREARGLLAQGRTAVRVFGDDGAALGSEVRVHVTTYAARPQMAIFGANDFSAAIARLADWAGYRVTIVDARSAFLASRRFTRHAETITAWPDEALRDIQLGPRDAVLVCSHDPKLDVPALLAAFRTDVGYVGALGSRRTTEDRAERLRAEGAGEADLGRLHAPCGLDIGAATAEETALAVLAEIVASRAGREGGHLFEAEGPIRRGRETALAPPEP